MQRKTPASIPEHPDLREIADDSIRSMFPQSGGLIAAVDPDDAAEAAAPTGLDTGQSILEQDRAIGRDAEPGHSFQEQSGCWLARQAQLVGVDTVDANIDKTVEPGHTQDERTVCT